MAGKPGGGSIPPAFVSRPNDKRYAISDFTIGKITIAAQPVVTSEFYQLYAKSFKNGDEIE